MAQATIPTFEQILAEAKGDSKKLIALMSERDKLVAQAAAAAATDRPVKAEWCGLYNGKPMVRLSGNFQAKQMGAASLRAICDAVDQIRAVLDNQPTMEELAQIEADEQMRRALSGKGKKSKASA